MSAIEHPTGIGLSPEDRVALARMARGTDRLAYRAKGILLLADGLSKAEIARRLRVSQNSVRQWARRWLADGGIVSLRRHGGKVANWRGTAPAVPNLPTRLPAAEAAILCRATAKRGHPVTVRTAIEAWVRDAAALGLAAPGTRLPTQTWFAGRFHVAPTTVAAAFASLARQGFVRNRRRIGSFLCDPFPFEKRYLLVECGGDQGLDQALIAAARRQEGRLGVRWDIRSAPPCDTFLELNADIAAQHWAGVFLRTSPSEDLPGWEILHLDRTPISGIIHALPSNGERAVPLARDERRGDKWNDAAETVLPALRADGRRRPLVIDTVRMDFPGRQEDAARRNAAKYGLEIPEACYQLLNFRHEEQNGTILAAVLHVAEWRGVDSVAILQDNFAPAVCDALARHFGVEAASRLPVFGWGNRPALPETRLPVIWHGFDFDATLDSFVEWCDAIHAGAKDPPPPRLATF